MIRPPTIVLNLIIINTLFFFGTFIAPKFNIDMNVMFDLFHPMTDYFKPWQLLTYMFMHANFSHLFFNMLGLYMFGAQLENYWGPKRFLSFYLITGIGAGLANSLINFLIFSQTGNIEVLAPMLGASGAVFGCLGGFGFMFPNQEMMSLFIPIPMKAKYWVTIYGVMELFFGVASNDNVAHYAHLGGLVVGLGLLFIWRKMGKV
jgi:membrane associated rhomboid family serine protease